VGAWAIQQSCTGWFHSYGALAVSALHLIVPIAPALLYRELCRRTHIVGSFHGKRPPFFRTALFL